MRCLSGNIWNARLFLGTTASSPTVMSAERRRCCSIPVMSMLPQRRVDDTESDFSRLRIASKSLLLRIVRIMSLLTIVLREPAGQDGGLFYPARHLRFVEVVLVDVNPASFLRSASRRNGSQR